MVSADVAITKPPLLDSGVIVRARAVAGHAHAAFERGVIVASLYAWVDEGFGPKNIYLLAEVARYIERISAIGHDWATGGDFNVALACCSLGPRLLEVSL